MHSHSFRDFHLLQLLKAYEAAPGKPLDLVAHDYFRSHGALGSHDRRAISGELYAMARWHGSLIALSPSGCWADRLALWRNPQRPAMLEALPAALRAGFPAALYELLVAQYGDEGAQTLCRYSNEEAPCFARVNALKTTRAELLRRWHGKIEAYPTVHSPYGLRFAKREALFATAEFKEGLFEVQDEGSQLVALQVAAKPGDQVLDYCAGSGGKALAIAPLLQGQGQIYLHDVRTLALRQARQRLRRAAVHNAQFMAQDSAALARLKKKMDWVLVDAPCSGSGTLRRNPDMKWRFDDELLRRLTGQQKVIFEKALSFLAPHGTIVYATCSILCAENEAQIDHFQKTYGLELVSPPLVTTPAPGAMDGFFAAVMRRR